VTDELKTMWKEAVVAYFKAPSTHNLSQGRD